MKRFTSLLLITVLAISLTACSGAKQPKVEYTPEANAVLSDFDKNNTWDKNATTVTLSDGNTQISGSGVTVKGNTVTVTAPGTYVFSGTLSEGQITVNAAKTDKVRIVLNGVSVSNNKTTPFHIVCADKVAVTLADESKNTFSDKNRPQPSENTDGTGEANACIYACDDITFNGTGSLTVEGSYNGIAGKNDIRLCGGTYDISAGNNGIKGKDSVLIAAGNIKVTAGKDGIKSDNQDETGRGVVHICGGTVSVKANDDGIQAITKILVEAGSVSVDAADDTTNCDGEISIKEGCLKEIN